MTKRLPMAPFILLPALQAPAAMPSAVRKQIEFSRLATGTITVDESGPVADYTLDGATDLGTELVDYSFDPDAGKGHESRWEAYSPGLANCRRGAAGMHRRPSLRTAWSPAA